MLLFRKRLWIVVEALLDKTLVMPMDKAQA